MNTAYTKLLKRKNKNKKHALRCLLASGLGRKKSTHNQSYLLKLKIAISFLT